MRDFGRGFARIHETLGEDSQGFATLGEDFTRIREIWERIWERIRKTLDFGRGFARIREDSRGCKTLGEDSQGFARLWERICKDS